MEEAEEKVDASMLLNLTNIEAEIAVLKSDAPRIQGLLNVTAKQVFEILKKSTD